MSLRRAAATTAKGFAKAPRIRHIKSPPAAATAPEFHAERVLAGSHSATSVAGISTSSSSRRAIKACGKGGQWEKALEIFRELPAAGIAADSHAYNACLRACADSPGPAAADQAVELLREMSEAGPGIEPNVFAYNSALVACGGGDDGGGGEEMTGRTLALLEEMVAKRIVPNAMTYDVALDACRGEDNKAEAERLLAEMPSRLPWDG